MAQLSQESVLPHIAIQLPGLTFWIATWQAALQVCARSTDKCYWSRQVSGSLVAPSQSTRSTGFLLAEHRRWVGVVETPLSSYAFSQMPSFSYETTHHPTESKCNC